MSKKVICVDDCKTVLSMLEMVLAELHKSGAIELSTYINPLDVVSEYIDGDGHFDLIICDLYMPEKNGFELISELKLIDKFANTPMLMLTTTKSDEMKAMGKEIGITGWMVKPFSQDKLVQSISMVLGL